MIPPFITENLSEDEINTILLHFVGIKRKGFGAMEIKVQDHKIVNISDILSENPATFKRMYAS